MDENSKTRQGVISLLDAELQHAGEETALSPLMLQLEQLRITPERELPRMEFLFRLFGKPCFPRGELVAITGKAKSGKTFVTSMLMAVGSRSPDSAADGEGSLTPAPSLNGEGSIYRLPLTREGKDPLRVLWYDTEQSDESTQDILRNRVLRMQTGGGTLDVFNVMRLFLDAMGGEQEVGGGELRDRVMRLSNLVHYRKYNTLLKQAVEQKVIVKDEREGRTFYRPAPF